MFQAEFIIPTRQKADLLFSSSEPILAGQVVEFPVRLVAGYSSLRVFAVADQPFQGDGDGSCSKDGPFGDLEGAPSSVDPVTGLNFLCLVIPHCYPYVKLIFTSLSAVDMQRFSLCLHGLPLGLSEG